MLVHDCLRPSALTLHDGLDHAAMLVLRNDQNVLTVWVRVLGKHQRPRRRER